MSRLLIIKIGGQVLDEEAAKQSFLRDFAHLDGLRILVHGGGKIATRIGEQLGIQPNYVNGRRITDEKTRDLVSMVYGGLVNKEIVARLQKLGCNAVGLTGADGNSLKAVKRPVGEIDFGYVGDITPEGVNSEFVWSLLQNKLTPVFAPLTVADGEILNTNADTIAATLAIALSKQAEVRLIYCFDKKGVLRDKEDAASVIDSLNEKEYQTLKKTGALADGILPKLENAFDTIHAGVGEVLIGEAADLIKNTGMKTVGTLITA